MPLISVVITLIVVGVLLWLVNTYIPMDGKIKQILNVVVVICVIVWLLYAFLMFWIDGATGHQADPWMRWLPVLTTGVSWPLVMLTLNASRVSVP